MLRVPRLFQLWSQRETLLTPLIFPFSLSTQFVLESLVVGFGKHKSSVQLANVLKQCDTEAKPMYQSSRSPVCEITQSTVYIFPETETQLAVSDHQRYFYKD